MYPKNLHSRSTGRVRADGTYNPNADRCRQIYRGVGADGKLWNHVGNDSTTSFMVADTRYELPLDFRMEAASVSETQMCRGMMSAILSDAEVGSRCGDSCMRGCDAVHRDLANAEGRAVQRNSVAHLGILRRPRQHAGGCQKLYNHCLIACNILEKKMTRLSPSLCIKVKCFVFPCSTPVGRTISR